jgi:hypothetical protein
VVETANSEVPVVENRPIRTTYVIPTKEYMMSNYKGISAADKQRIISALKSRGAGGCPRCDDSQWTVSEYSRIDVQSTSAGHGTSGASIPTVMIVCQHCGYIAQHALQPLGLWSNEGTIAGAGQSMGATTSS